MRLSSFVSLAVGLAVVGGLVAAYDPAATLRLLLESGGGLLLVILLHVPQVAASALGWAPLILDPRRPGLLALTRFRWMRESANAVLPVVQAAGELVRAQLLLRTGVERRMVVAGVAVDLSTEMASQIAFSLLGLGVLLLIPHAGSEGATLTWAIAGTVAGALVTAGFMAAQRWGLFRVAERLLPGLASRLGWQLGDLSGLHETVVRLYARPSRLWRSGAWHLVSWLIGVVEAWVALRVLGIEAGLAEALVIESLGQVVRSMGFFVPGALGVQEGGFLLIFGLFGIPPEQAMAFALFRRLRDVTMGVPGVIAWRMEVSGPARDPDAGAERAR